MLTYFEWHPRILYFFFLLFRGRYIFILFFSGVSFSQAVFKAAISSNSCKKALSCSGIAVSAAHESLILLHSFSVVEHFITKTSVRAHMLPATESMLGSAGQVLAKAFMAFAEIAWIGHVVQLTAPWLWLDHDQGKLKVLGSSGNCFVPFERSTSFEASMNRMHDVSGVDYVTLLPYSMEDEAFGFWTSLTLSRVKRLISSSRLYSANLHRWDV